MNTAELAAQLVAAGCNPLNYAIGTRGTASDAFCLTHDGTHWQVYYTERGQDHAPIFVSTSESAACAFFLAHMQTIRHDHCVGFFRSAARAQALLIHLQQLGLDPWHDQIIYTAPDDRRFRVFVSDTAIHTVRATFGTDQIHD
jgi:hypothetical protein